MTDIKDIIDEVTGANFGDMFRARPYDGQPHTDLGKRGKTEIEGITFRDLRDCFIRAIALSAGPGPLYQEGCKGERANISENDIYKINLNELDPIAIQQNLTCEVEKLMGIYPNMPELKVLGDD
jgi:hypothetical protein